MTFDDPYQWLEKESEEVLAWQNDQRSFTESYLLSLGTLDQIESAIRSLEPTRVTSLPVRRGGRWFCVASEGFNTSLEVSDSPGQRGHKVIESTSIDWFYPSPDGRFISLGLSEGGTEQSVLHVVDAESGEFLGDRIPHTADTMVAWFEDSSGFYYTAGHASQKESMQRFVYRHRLGSTVSNEPEDLDFGEIQRVWTRGSWDGRYVTILAWQDAHPQPWYTKQIGTSEWTQLFGGLAGLFSGDVFSDTFIAITTNGAPRGRIVAVPPYISNRSEQLEGARRCRSERRNQITDLA